MCPSGNTCIGNWFIKLTRLILMMRCTGMWDVSCAGHLSAGESSVQAALAEINEELGIDNAQVVNQNNIMDAGQIIGYIRNNLLTTDNQTSLYHLCRIPRTQISGGGQFIDREHTDIYCGFIDYTIDQYKLQADEVDAVQYIDIDEFIAIQQSVDRCNQLSYVPINEFNKYYQHAFSIIKLLQQYITATNDSKTN